jgi:hypothetical protein
MKNFFLLLGALALFLSCSTIAEKAAIEEADLLLTSLDNNDLDKAISLTARPLKESFFSHRD